MERRRWCRRAAWGGAITTVLGIVLFALFSDAGGACTANVIVLSDGVIGPHGCAASSIAYHAGIGLMVLGVALLLGACLLSVFGRGAQAASGSGAPGATEGNAAGPQERAREEPVALPPGWYGNPSNRNGSVLWWDGHRLVDRRPAAGEDGVHERDGR
jgi:hypothetical protein